MLVLLMSLTANAADCKRAVSPNDLESLSDEATLAWAAMDQDGFEEIAERVIAGVACLDEPVAPSQAASVHGLRGLKAFLDGDAEAAKMHLQAAYAADPDYRMSTRIAPEGGKLWRLAEDAREMLPTEGKKLSLLDGGTVWVDGHESGKRADDRPSLVQVGAGDRTTWSHLLEPGEAFKPPAEALASLPTDIPDVIDEPRTPRKPSGGGGGKGLYIAAGGAGAVAAGLFGTSAILRTRYDASPSQGLHDATNGTFIASTGLAAVTGGLLAAAVVNGRKASR